MVGIRRSDMQIVQDILRMETGAAAKLRLSANLSYSQLQQYVAFLEQLDLIELDRQSTRSLAFRVTDKGRQVLELLDTLFGILGLGPNLDHKERGVEASAPKESLAP